MRSTDGGAAGATDPHKWSALHYAASEGRTDVAMLLLGAGAPVDCLNIDGWTPLHFAARAGHGKVAALLLEAGANKNVRTQWGTALAIATQEGHAEVAALLR